MISTICRRWISKPPSLTQIQMATAWEMGPKSMPELTRPIDLIQCFFDYIPDGVIDRFDYLKLVLNWHLDVEDLSFDKVGDLDDSGRIDNQDIFFYQEGIFR